MPLIILAHPNYHSSLVNKTIINEVQKNHAGLEIRNIHQLYPNYQINVEAEQDALLRHDTIVFQFPFYWYSIPAILKLWIDDVLTYQFAYGSHGDKLKNKKTLISTTIGQPEEAFLSSKNHTSTESFFESLRHTINYAQMDYMGLICTYGVSPVLNYTEEEKLAKAILHAKKLREKLEVLENLKMSAVS